MHKFKEDEEVYVVYIDEIEECWIDECIPTENIEDKPMYIVKTMCDCSFLKASEDCIFSTEEEAKIGLEKHISSEIEECKSKIKTVQDLVSLPLSLSFSYSKFEKQAYKQKVKELLGIEIENTWF